nr:carbonic anhydrase [uncultured Roseateles sp.]
MQAMRYATLSLVCCLLAGQTWANEPAAPVKKTPAKAAVKTETKAEAGMEAKPAATASRGGDETLDSLRMKLAERLGTKPDGSPGQMQLTTKGGPAAPAGRAGAKAASAPVGHGAEIHWGYDGQGGPERWGQLRPDFNKCASGTRQSPIDIREGIAVDLEPIAFDYKPSNFSVIDNGHTVQVNVAQGNAIQIMGRRYELLQFHFHRPSEERINGRQFDMVAHLVHKDAEGRLAVVAVLLDRGSTHALIQTVWANLPLEKNELQQAQVMLDLNQLLPESRLYYTYMGSLTTPPCSEGVLWMVLKQPVQVSNQQINIFSRLYPMNARPVQPAQGRLIKESN